MKHEILNRYFKHNCNKEEKGAVQKWFKTEEGMSFLEQTLSKDLENDAKDIHISHSVPTSEMFSKIENKLNRSTANVQWMKIAAVVTPLFIFSSLLLSERITSFFSEDEVEWFSTYIPKGEKRQLLLQDGSKIWVNANSTIAYPSNFNKKNRHVKLSGEGFFEITKDQSSPFTVEIDGLEIKVLGTTFNARSYEKDEDICVVLKEGLIKVSERIKDAPEYYIQPGEMMVYSKANKEIEISQPDATSPFSDWRNDRFVFRNTSLKEVLHILENRYNYTFQVEDTTLYEYTYMLSFQQQTLEQVIKDMERITPVSFKKQKNETFLVSRKTK